jgi:ribulose-phosphate 3-epimerase
MKILVSPSILAADFGKLNEEIASVEDAGADMLHVDVMDGHFVPNLSFGVPVVRSIKTRLPMDVHLMVENPVMYIDDFAKIGVRTLFVHFEACDDFRAVLMRVIESGVSPGVVLNPKTPLSSILEVMDVVENVLVMSVEPGFGGQKFDESVLDKIEELRARFPNVNITVDGGINEKTAEMCRVKGANILVSGSYIFKAEDRALAISKLRGE